MFLVRDLVSSSLVLSYLLSFLVVSLVTLFLCFLSHFLLLMGPPIGTRVARAAVEPLAPNYHLARSGQGELSGVRRGGCFAPLKQRHHNVKRNYDGVWIKTYQ